jgi:sensor histidine kinase YesM
LDWGEAVDCQGTGTGLENVRNRLENAYSKNYRFEIHKGDNTVCIKIEIKTAEQTGE